MKPLRHPGWSIVAGAIGWAPITCIAGVWPWTPDETFPIGAWLVWTTWSVVTYIASRRASALSAAITALLGVPSASLIVGGIALALHALFGDDAARTGHTFDVGEHFVIMQWREWPALIAAGLAGGALAASTSRARQSARAESLNVIVVVLGAIVSLAIVWLAPARYDIAAMLEEPVLATTSRVPEWMVRVPCLTLALAAYRGWQLRTHRHDPSTAQQ